MTMEGGCTCGKVRYRLASEPIVVHSCHCRWCQRETGTAFATNALIESDRLELTGQQPEKIDTPSESGKGQQILRCPHCRVAVWSYYAGARDKLAFVRVGTLDNPGACPPDVHIFTASKVAWLTLPADVPTFAEFYERADVPALYGSDGAARWARVRAGG